MNTIKEQLIGLGLVHIKKSEPKCNANFIEDNEKTDINHQVMMKILELIITRNRFSKVSTYLLKQGLSFPPNIKNKLKKLHENSIKKNYLDEVEFKKYILSLDFDIARKRFDKRQEQIKSRKKKAQPYEMKTFVNSKASMPMTDTELTFPKQKKVSKSPSKKINRKIIAIDDIDTIISQLSMNGSYNSFIRLLNFSQLKLSKGDKHKLRTFYRSIRKQKKIVKSELVSFVNQINRKNARLDSLGAEEKSKLQDVFKDKPLRDKKQFVEDKLQNRHDSIKIGFGLESEVKIERVRAADVVIDKNTKNTSSHDKHILYAAGWSLKK